jgi:hypothetical protein
MLHPANALACEPNTTLISRVKRVCGGRILGAGRVPFLLLLEIVIVLLFL